MSAIATRVVCQKCFLYLNSTGDKLKELIVNLCPQHPFVRTATSNRPLMELVAEANAEVMEEIEDNREEGEDDDTMDLIEVPHSNVFFCLIIFIFLCQYLFLKQGVRSISSRVKRKKQLSKSL